MKSNIATEPKITRFFFALRSGETFTKKQAAKRFKTTINNVTDMIHVLKNVEGWDIVGTPVKTARKAGNGALPKRYSMIM